MTFPIAIEPGDETHAFGVVVPDLPGCFSAADTLDEVMTHAKEAILLHMEGMIAEGMDFPKTQPIEVHMSNPDFAGWIWAVVEVEDIRESHQAVRVNITMPKNLLDRVDKQAMTRHMTRSGYLAEAARKMMAEAS
ncbi:MAG: type II toxin-antitoxin system HicB family antitoxin [Magnetococcales bacterium]|nr:type II toxin-antitoxin system HicB family antitoxin [Magnetococcales bacterium]